MRCFSNATKFEEEDDKDKAEEGVDTQGAASLTRGAIFTHSDHSERS